MPLWLLGEISDDAPDILRQLPQGERSSCHMFFRQKTADGRRDQYRPDQDSSYNQNPKHNFPQSGSSSRKEANERGLKRQNDERRLNRRGMQM
jgi:hypothetical protein